mmetsp:Transcript_8002/g.21651  ORF Transcript_8002/g.21651 Transcript_8002/m.21651 type:complete len:155 (+) Transcript_8002:228-692(+)
MAQIIVEYSAHGPTHKYISLSLSLFWSTSRILIVASSPVRTASELSFIYTEPLEVSLIGAGCKCGTNADTVAARAHLVPTRHCISRTSSERMCNVGSMPLLDLADPASAECANTQNTRCPCSDMKAQSRVTWPRGMDSPPNRTDDIAAIRLASL